jgi:hypothetical protein
MSNSSASSSNEPLEIQKLRRGIVAENNRHIAAIKAINDQIKKAMIGYGLTSPPSIRSGGGAGGGDEAEEEEEEEDEEEEEEGPPPSNSASASASAFAAPAPAPASAGGGGGRGAAFTESLKADAKAKAEAELTAALEKIASEEGMPVPLLRKQYDIELDRYQGGGKIEKVGYGISELKNTIANKQGLTLSNKKILLLVQKVLEKESLYTSCKRDCSRDPTETRSLALAERQIFCGCSRRGGSRKSRKASKKSKAAKKSKRATRKH